MAPGRGSRRWLSPAARDRNRRRLEVTAPGVAARPASRRAAPLEASRASERVRGPGTKSPDKGWWRRRESFLTGLLKQAEFAFFPGKTTE